MDALFDWIFVREVALPSLAVQRIVTLHAPGPMEEAYVTLEEDRLSIVDLFGAVLQIRWPDGEPLCWRPRPLDLPRDEWFVNRAVIAPGGRYVWLPVARVAGTELRVYDLERWPRYRLCAAKGEPLPLIGSDEPAVAVPHIDRGVSLYKPSGAPLGHSVDTGDNQVFRVAVHPDGHPLLAVVSGASARQSARMQAPAELLGQIAERPIGVFRCEPQGKGGDTRLFSMTDVRRPHQLASSRTERRVYLKVSLSHASQLHAWGIDDEVGRAPRPPGPWVSTSTCFFTDARSRHVCALAMTADGLRVHALDASDGSMDVEPVARSWFWTEWSVRGLDFDLGCEADGGTLTQAGGWVHRRLEKRAAADVDRAVAELQEQHAEDPGGLFDLAAALYHLDRSVASEALIEETGRRFPDHPRWRLLRASAIAREGRQEEVLPLLRDVDILRLEPAFAQHLLHLRGMAMLREGDLAGGARELRAAAKIPGVCDLNPALALLDVLEGTSLPTEMTDGPSYLRVRLAHHIGSILEAEKALGRGDFSAAIQALDTASVWRIGDRQSLARLAEAWLATKVGDPAVKVRRMLALAAFLHVHHGYAEGHGSDIPLPPHSWGPERLGELAMRVRAALEDPSDDGAHPP